jgi:hypothetical protein
VEGGWGTIKRGGNTEGERELESREQRMEAGLREHIPSVCPQFIEKPPNIRHAVPLNLTQRAVFQRK